MLDVLTLDGLDWKAELRLSPEAMAFGAAETDWCERAYNHRRLAAVAARWSGELPILVVTFGGLAEAHTQAGPGASALDVLRALGAMQELPAEGLPWHNAASARFVVSSALREARDGRAFAQSSLQCVFVAPNGFDSLATAQAGAGPWPYLPADRILLHEVGHVLQHAHNLHVNWSGFPLSAKRRIPAVDCNLLSLMRRHHGECFAEAFACLALMASGVPRVLVEDCGARIMSGVNAGLTWRLACGFPDTPVLRADLLIYQTFAAEALAMREQAPESFTDVLQSARRSAGRGALGPDVLLRMLESEERPEWFEDFDPQGLKTLRADQRRARPLWGRGIDSMLSVLGTIDDPVARYQRRMGMAMAVHRGNRLERRDWTALQEIGAKPLEAWMAPLVRPVERPIRQHPSLVGPLDLAA